MQLPDHRRQLLTPSRAHTHHCHRLAASHRPVPTRRSPQHTTKTGHLRTAATTGPFGDRTRPAARLPPARRPIKPGPAVDPSATTASGRAPSLRRRTSQGHKAGRPGASANPQWEAGRSAPVKPEPVVDPFAAAACGQAPSHRPASHQHGQLVVLATPLASRRRQPGPPRAVTMNSTHIGSAHTSAPAFAGAFAQAPTPVSIISDRRGEGGMGMG